MPEVSPSWIVAAITTAGAVVGGWWTYRSSRAQAQPNAQDAINAGFTKLAERQDREMEKLSKRVNEAEKKADEAKRKAELAVDGLTSARNWHVRHAARFDKPVIQVLEEVAPEKVAPLVETIESDPFPQLPGDL